MIFLTGTSNGFSKKLNNDCFPHFWGEHIRRGIEVVITGLTRNQFARKRTRVRIPSSPPILTKNTFETIGFERVFCCICTSGPRFFRDFPRLFSIPPKSRKRLLHKAFLASKNSCKRHFSVLFALFSCFLSVFCEFLTCFRHFYAVPRTLCAVKFGQLHGFFHRFQRLGFVIPTEVRVNVACCLDVRVT